ncbi:hypothetical protein DENSPDRAFT_839781 [Dentipellis sp. KUC8613]|nr:hypothetical protein DENSPDRAFT_839781 [Dentipellis sp. KUC8613]
MVFSELKDHTSIVDTDAFLNAILPLEPESINDVLEKLKTDRIYTNGRWAGFPNKIALEKELYGPFVKNATAILEACGSSSGHSLHDLCWVKRPDSTPISLDKLTPASRPDVMAVFNYHDAKGEEEKKQEEEISRCEQDLADLPKNPVRLQDQHKKKELDAKKTELTKKLNEFLKIKWLHVHLPVEFKRSTAEKDVIDGANQLCRYMRHVLREQLDRRFAFGLLFCKNSLSVWLCHRSGLVGTKTSFNIHDEPQKFIQVIMALACLDPARLGWDRTMKLYRMHSGQSFYTTDAEAKGGNDFSDNLYGTKWLITVPEQDGMSGGESYVTLHALSTVRASVKCGRATVVWVVMNLKTRERFVLKQSWLPETSLRESDICSVLPRTDDSDPHVCDIVRSVSMACPCPDPHHPDWKLDDTEHSITRGLELEGSFALERAPPAATTDQPKPVKRKLEDPQPIEEVDEEATFREQGLFVVSTDSDAYKFAVRKARKLETPPVNRILTRTLMRTYGWPIKFFKDIPELVRALRDAVQGHRNLWLRGVLHRDVSTNNILICPKGSDIENTSGCLIDFDYAKKAETFAQILHTAIEPDEPDFLRSMVQRNANCKKWQITLDQSAAEALARRYSDFLDNVPKYVTHVLDNWYLPEQPHGRQLSAADLFTEDGIPKSICNDSGHDHMNSLPPSWEDHIPQPGERTGTTAFMSYEILTSKYYNDTRLLRADSKQHTHSAIHDLESFFWVLLYLCVTRKGPGGARRDELIRNEQDTNTQAIHSVVYCLFDSDKEATLADNKELFFESPGDLNEYIFPCFHPYFEPLKPLISTWWKVLRLGYFSYDAITQTFIHQRVLNILDNFLETFVPEVPSPEIEKATNEELQRRRGDLGTYVLPAPNTATPVTPPAQNQPLPNSGEGTSKEHFTDSPERAHPASTSYKGQPSSSSPAQKRRKGSSGSSRSLHG